jgi:hypothetical protein
VATQVTVAEWHARFPDPTIADAILDRLVHNAYRLALKGESRRKVDSALPMPTTRVYNAHASVASLRHMDGIPGTRGRFHRNTQNLAPAEALIRTSIADQCRTMLSPPVSMVGVPAMEKLAREIARWPEELGEDTAAACLRQVREYLNSPPDPWTAQGRLAGDHLTAGRDLYITFLEEAGAMAGLDFSESIRRLRASMAIISHLAGAVRQDRLEEAAAHVRHIAQEETEAYTALSGMAGAS